MIFLNDVEEGGECAFPVADNATFSWEVNKQKKKTLSSKHKQLYSCYNTKSQISRKVENHPELT